MADNKPQRDEVTCPRSSHHFQLVVTCRVKLFPLYALAAMPIILRWRNETRLSLVVLSKTNVFQFSEFLEHSLFGQYCPGSCSNHGSSVCDWYNSFSVSGPLVFRLGSCREYWSELHLIILSFLCGFPGNWQDEDCNNYLCLLCAQGGEGLSSCSSFSC